MFCKNCGRKISDRQKFCEFCGDNVSSSCQVYSVREEEISLVDNLISFFSQKKELYDEYDKVTVKIDKLKDVCARAALVWGIILSVVMTIPSMFSFLVSFMVLFDGPGYPGIAILFLLLSIVFVLPGVGLTFLYITRNKKRKEMLETTTNRFSEISEELLNHYITYEKCPVGIVYTNPNILWEIKNILQSGRADNIKEALNILLCDAHRRKMEDLAIKTAQYVESNYKLTKVAVVASIADLLD